MALRVTLVCVVLLFAVAFGAAVACACGGTGCSEMAVGARCACSRDESRTPAAMALHRSRGARLDVLPRPSAPLPAQGLHHSLLACLGATTPRGAAVVSSLRI